MDLADDRWFLVFAAVCLAVVGFGVIRLREGTTGRYLQALHMSPIAAASIGISGIRSRVVAFAVAAGIAGFGGGLMASYLGQANYQASFGYLFGLVWVALVVSAGARSVQAAVMAGMFFFLVPALLERLFAWPQNLLDTHPDMWAPLASALGWVSPYWAAARGVHPVRVRRHHLRPAPRRQHRGPDRHHRQGDPPSRRSRVRGAPPEHDGTHRRAPITSVRTTGPGRTRHPTRAPEASTNGSGGRPPARGAR